MTKAITILKQIIMGTLNIIAVILMIGSYILRYMNMNGLRT